MVSKAKASALTFMQMRDLPIPDSLRMKSGDDGVHLNGVQFVKVQNFRGRKEANLGIAHLIVEAEWKQNWTLAMENAVYGEGDIRSTGQAYLDAYVANPGRPFNFEQSPSYEGNRVLSSYITGKALVYQHYMILVSASPPFQLLEIATKELPLHAEASSQPWFEKCGDLHESVHYWKKWEDHGTERSHCGLSVSFVSGFDQVGDSLLVAYGVGDSKSHMLRMALAHAETLFSEE